MTNENLKTACFGAGMHPLCFYSSLNNPSVSADCSVGRLDLVGMTNSHRLASELCPEYDRNNIGKSCPILDGLFFFVAGNASRGVSNNINDAVGDQVTSGEGQKLHYAACIKDAGLFF